MVRECLLWCLEYQTEDGVSYRHFYPHPKTVSCFDGDLTPVQVKVTETTADECYWAWWHNDSKMFRHVYPIPEAVRCCFPDLEFAEERGVGHLCRVHVTPLERNEDANQGIRSD